MLQFKTERIKTEWENELEGKNAKLKRLVAILAEFVALELGKDVVLTEIFRSNEEYKALYASNPSAMPKRPPHTLWQAVDLRSSIYTDVEVKRILEFLKQFRFYAGQRSVGVYHQIAGNVMHFHVQYGNDT